MPYVIGLILIPIIIVIIRKVNKITTLKKQRVMLNGLLILIALGYIIFVWAVRTEPFDFEIHYSLEYMIYSGEFILYTGLIFIFSPFMWIIVVHFIRMLFRAIRVRKNAIIKNNEDYIYYRGDLDKIPHSIIMFTSQLEIDLRKCISATILKLKLTGYIEEKDEHFVYTEKDENDLYESEKMVLHLIKYNQFHKNEYIKAIEKETLKHKYLTKNRGGALFRIIKIVVAICIPIAIYSLSEWTDQYQFKNYPIIPEDDGHVYVGLGREDEAERLFNNKVIDENDYYHRICADGSVDYNYGAIRADKMNYRVVRKALYLMIFNTLIIGWGIAVGVLIAVYIIIEQIIYFNKNYTRTIKGKILLNKAYALKNYLKEYSLIKDRTEKELVLWEYYLIYAVALDVNVKIEDKIIEKYIREI